LPKDSVANVSQIVAIDRGVRRRRSKAEDRLDGAAATKALGEAAERIPYQKAHRDLDL
jgi:hypothetical protein